ncbi:MAG: glycosyltransferase family 2 protein [Bacilli bacterium]|nr:glycosyltransferase family 2 protein [Bacilli bacterium]
MDVSIIIPVYNNESYVKECIDSLINQKTKYKYEIIAVNDGSKDNSLEVLKSYGDKIILIDKENSGPGDTRNVAIKRAVGKYIMFADSDDYARDDFVETMVGTLEKEKADIVICDFMRIDPDKTYHQHKGQAGTYLKGHINDVLMMGFHSTNKVFKKEYFKNDLYPKGMFFEDVALIPKLLLKANKIVKIDDPLYYYRNNNKGTTNVINYTNYDLYTAITMIDESFRKEGYLEELEFMYIDSILVDLMIKIVKSRDPEKKKKFFDLKNKVEEKYPKWYKNKYIKKCKFTKRLYLHCLRRNYWWIISKVFSR